MPGMLTAVAPAKLNLSLVVTGKNSAGYHLLDSIVGFTRFGDRLTLLPAREVSLEVTGPFAPMAGPGEDNLVWRAAQALMPLRLDPGCGVRLILEKHIPVGAGLGGGSSDAALALQLLRQFWCIDLPAKQLAEIGLSLGADVPVCLTGKTSRMRGIGDRVTPVSGRLSNYAVLLVNPGVQLPTATIFQNFRRFAGRRYPVAVSADLQAVQRSGNSLTAAAIEQLPEIADLLAFLSRSQEVLLARMSGSGATCFALYSHHAHALRHAQQIANKFAHWCHVTRIY